MVNSYNTLINTLQQFAQHHLGVQRFKTSFFEQFDNFSTGDNNFPILYVVPQDVTMLEEVDSLFIRVYCVDILQKDRSNEQFILNDTLLILRDLINWIRQDATVNYNVLNNPRAIPVNNFLVDFTTGWYVDIELESESYGNDCVIPFDVPFNITGLTQDINYALPFLTCDTLASCQTFLDVQLTGLTYNPSNNQLTVSTAGGQSLSAQINAFSGLTINGVLSATTYFGDGSNLTGLSIQDTYVTGGTYSDGTAIFTNNTGGTFNVSGFYTGATDVFVTGATYNNLNEFVYTNNTGGTFSVSFEQVSGFTINGNLIVTGNTNLQAFSATTGYLYSSGSTIFQIDGNQGTLMNVGNNSLGIVLNINTPSGFPIFDIYDDSTILMGSYLAPSLNTTAKVTATGTTSIYAIPTSGYTGAFFDYVVSNGTNLRAGNIMSIWNGASINFTEVTTNSIGNTSAVTFSVILSGGNAILRITSSSGTWITKTIVRAI